MYLSGAFTAQVLLTANAFALPAFSSLSHRVKTTVGTVEGSIDASSPGLVQWLGIPFAEPPVGARRWTEPVPKAKSLSVIEAKTPPKSCAQYMNPNQTVFNTFVPEFLATAPISEDCLYLNVIAPAGPRKNLPVLFWIHGGEIQYGGINTLYERPHKWVARSQSHIVVQINYRKTFYVIRDSQAASYSELTDMLTGLNIFGWPNAKGLTEKNFGILDQRLAAEWVRDNIAAFGGDPKKITGWGQSAGGSAIDAHQFAWPNDPIFSSIIDESSPILIATTTKDEEQASFSWVAQQAGCGANLTAQGELDCLRRVDADALSSVIMDHVKTGAAPSLYFSAHADGKRVFTPAEYVAKGNAGHYAGVPMLLGTNAQEVTSVIPFAAAMSLPATSIAALTNEIIQCPVAATCKYRETSGKLTYRYYYAGNFSNISPAPWLGAYHFSELPLIMGTHSDFRGRSTPFETSLSHKLQDLWLAFARDPEKGLDYHGWPRYSSSGQALVFGENNVLVQKRDIASLDAACN